MPSYVRIGIALLCVIFAVTTGAGAGAADPTIAQTTSPHVHPDEVDDDSDPESVSAQLKTYLLSSIRESTAALEEGDYDRAASAVGAEYDQYLEQFKQTDNENEAAAFEAVRDEQRRFINATEAYDTTYAEYQEARNSGDEQRARELARELEEHHTATQESGSALESEYERIESFSNEEEEIDLEGERTAIQSIQEDINQRQESVQTVEFTETTLTVEAESTTISFLEPLTLRGELRTADGAPLANEEVTFVINDRETTVTTDATGQFTLVHRPTTMPLDTEQVTVQYAPAPGSTYLGSSATVPVALEQVEPTIEVTDRPEEVAFGEEMTVRGSVTADGTGAGDVPVVIQVDNQHLGTTTTDANGTYELTTTFPAEAASGESTVDVTIPVGDRALAGTSTSEPIAISETASNLTLSAQPTGENALEVTGQLTTANGTGIAGQPITVRVDGSSVATLETADDGTYEGTISAEQIGGPSGRTDVEVVAVYSDDGNVGGSQATTNVDIDEGTEPGGLIGIVSVIFASLSELFGLNTPDLNLGDQSFGPVHWLVLLTFAIGLPLSSYPFVRYLGPDDDEYEPATEETEREQPREAASQPLHQPVNMSLDDARTLTEEDPKRAVEVAYTIVRTELAEHTDETARTPREFYQVCQSNGFSNEELAALKTLTDQYEHAAFAQRPVSTTKAERTIDTATQFIK